MFKLTAFLCAAMFLALLVGGEDRGQLRPGLMKAAQPTGQQLTIATQDGPAQAEIAPPTPLAADLAQPLVLPVMQPVPAQDDTVADAVAQAVSDSAVNPAPPVWHVTARSVNVRSGPGTENPVVGRLTRGEAVSLVWMEDNGWARILIEGDGIEGYVYTDFLAESPYLTGCCR